MRRRECRRWSGDSQPVDAIAAGKAPSLRSFNLEDEPGHVCRRVQQLARPPVEHARRFGTRDRSARDGAGRLLAPETSSRRSPAPRYTSTIYDGKRARAGWTLASPWQPFSGGLDTRTSRKRAPTSVRHLGLMNSTCKPSRSASGARWIPSYTSIWPAESVVNSDRIPLAGWSPVSLCS